MTSSLDAIDALKIEITNLEFQKEIVLHWDLGWGDPDNEVIDDEIRTREAQIAGLRGRLDLLISALPERERMGSATYHRQICPFIPSLPCEILSLVFKQGAMDSGSGRTNFALSVSQVSRYWRETAIQIPFLWSFICLRPRCTRMGYQMFLLILLKRSQAHPLDILLAFWETVDLTSPVLHQTQRSQSPPPEQPKMKQRLQDQLLMFIPEVSRWRTFTYECEDRDDVRHIRMLLADLSAPILESFTFVASLAIDTDQAPHNIFSGGTPKLSLVSLYGIQPFACLPPLSSITTLDLGGWIRPITGATFLRMLRYLRLLVNLFIGGKVVDPISLHELVLRGEFVEIATLRSLSFSAATESPKYCMDGILNTIRCPAVESMSIFCRDFWNGGQRPWLSSALPLPRFPALRSMKLVRIHCDQFVKYFDVSSLSGLRIISLSHCTSPMALLCLLLPSAGRVETESVWPLLKVVELTQLGEEEVEGICSIISHRHACGKPLEAVKSDINSLEKFPEKFEWMKQQVAVQCVWFS
jgi:hypothetical protein